MAVATRELQEARTEQGVTQQPRIHAVRREPDLAKQARRVESTREAWLREVWNEAMAGAVWTRSRSL
jgi:hypothetical protein